MKSIQTVYKSIFGQALEPMGFIYSKQMKFFFRLINGEIIQFIILKPGPSKLEGYKDFSVSAGIRTIYTETMEKDLFLNSTRSLMHFGGLGLTYEQRGPLLSTPYSDATIEESVNFALEKTLEYIIPRFSEVTDLASCIEYYKGHGLSMLKRADSFSEDSLILIKANNHDTFMSELHESVARDLKGLKEGKAGDDYDSTYELFYRAFITFTAEPRDRVYNDPELYAKALAEIERRAAANLEVLKSYGLPI